MHAARVVRLTCSLLLIAAGSTTAGQAQINVCVDYGCDLEHPIHLSRDEWQSIGSLFDEARSAADERAAVKMAVGRLEQIAGLQAGTQGDLPENSGGHGGRGQLDCIAESINTSRYLQMLEHASLLRWHRVKERAKRHRYIFSTHWSAVLERPDTGEAFAVDSWYGRNGDPALVIPLEQWRQGVRPDTGNH